jgi:hypothetical protein
MNDPKLKKLAHVVGDETVAAKLVAAGIATPAAIRAAGMDVWETILTTDEIGNMPDRLWPEGYVTVGVDPEVASIDAEDVLPMPILSGPLAIPKAATKPKKSK